MGLMLNFFRAYPWQTVMMMVALLLSGIAEGIGLSALLPLLNIALGAEAASLLPGAASPEQSEFERIVLETLATVGIAPTLGNMLGIILAGADPGFAPWERFDYKLQCLPQSERLGTGPGDLFFRP